MKKVIAPLALVLLVLSVSTGTLRAEESKLNNFGFRLHLDTPNDSSQWESGNGYGLYGLFALNPSSKSKKKTYLKASLDFADYDSKVDWLSEGTLEAQTFSLSILSVTEGPSAKTYFGGGLSFMTNDFEISDHALESIWDFLDILYASMGEILLSMEYEEWVDDAMGFHILAGAEVALSKSTDFQIELVYSFVTADAGGDLITESTDGFWIYTDEESLEDEIKLGNLSISIGLSTRF